jgi:hypothetical protein
MHIQIGKSLTKYCYVYDGDGQAQTAQHPVNPKQSLRAAAPPQKPRRERTQTLAHTKPTAGKTLPITTCRENCIGAKSAPN